MEYSLCTFYFSAHRFSHVPASIQWHHWWPLGQVILTPVLHACPILCPSYICCDCHMLAQLHLLQVSFAASIICCNHDMLWHAWHMRRGAAPEWIQPACPQLHHPVCHSPRRRDVQQLHHACRLRLRVWLQRQCHLCIQEQ